MSNWFKLVCNNRDSEKWMIDELKEGKLRFGWSPPGSDLRILHEKDWNELDNITIGNDEWSESGRYIYNQSKFLLFRIQNNDRIIVQFTQPLREFYICEVTGEYYCSGKEFKDFNHILPCKLIAENSIPLNSKYISNSLRHALTKRGKYYGIYPENAVKELNNLVDKKIWINKDLNDASSHEIEMDKTKDALIKNTIRLIRNWESKHFESIMKDILNSVPTIEVKQDYDSGKGWDLLLKMEDPVTAAELYENIPVQCKNYSGDVNTEKPLDDIKRCFSNLKDISVAYIAILGDLTDDFWNRLRQTEKQLSAQLKREIRIRIIDQDQIAKLYLKMQGNNFHHKI